MSSDLAIACMRGMGTGRVITKGGGFQALLVTDSERN